MSSNKPAPFASEPFDLHVQDYPAGQFVQLHQFHQTTDCFVHVLSILDHVEDFLPPIRRLHDGVHDSQGVLSAPPLFRIHAAILPCTTIAAPSSEPTSSATDDQHNSLEALRSANTPDAGSVGLELDEAETVDGVDLPGDFIAEELIVQVVPQADDEFTCYSCFLVRHRSQVARQKNGQSYCVECEG